MGLGYRKPAASLLSFDYMDLNNKPRERAFPVSKTGDDSASFDIDKRFGGAMMQLCCACGPVWGWRGATAVLACRGRRQRRVQDAPLERGT